MLTLKKIRNHSVFRNTVALGLVKVADILFPLLTTPYLTRKLTVDSFGLLVVLTSYYVLAKTITDFGLGQFGSYEVSRNIENKKHINNFLFSTYAIKLFLFLLSILIINYYLLFINKNEAVNNNTLILVSLVILSFAYQTHWFFQGIEKMKLITYIILITKSSYFILIFTLIPFAPTANTVLFCIFISNIMSTIACQYLMYKEGYKLEFVNIFYILKVAKNGFSFFVSRIALDLYSTANTIVMSLFAPYSQIAIFGVAEKLYNLGMSVVSPMNDALYPYMARTSNNRFLFKYVSILVVLACFVCGILFNYSDSIIAIIFGEKYRSASIYFNLFLIITPINVASIIMGYPAFASIGKPKIVNYIIISASLIYLVCLIWLYLFDALSIVNLIISIMLIDTISLVAKLILFFRLR